MSGERLARVTWSLIAEPTDAAALLIRERLGPVAALELAREATPAEALEALGTGVPLDLPESPGTRSRGSDRSRLEQALERWRARLRAVDVDAVRQNASRGGMRVIIPGDDHWPVMLDDLGPGAPHCLWATGPVPLRDLVEEPSSIALVGSRASTAYGEDCAAGFAAALASRGATIVSGGAYGIDAAAHRGALAATEGATIAVMAGGLDRLYPRGNARLLEAIRERCLLVTEAPPGTSPTRWRFLARNRLIAALSAATIVVEASWRSGALNTARHADDLSRPVGAVPGPVGSAASAGCHRLIRERGAVLVTDAAEILELVRGQGAAEETGHQLAREDELDLLSPADRRVLEAIPPRSAISLDALALESASSPDAVQAALARMELLGLVHRAGDRARRSR